MQRKSFQPHLRSLLSACAAALIISGCSDSPTGPVGPQGEFVLRASVVGTTIATMVVEVTAPDITTPLAFNIPIVNGVATGTVKLPPGENRTITLKAFDDMRLREGPPVLFHSLRSLRVLDAPLALVLPRHSNGLHVRECPKPVFAELAAIA